MSAKRARRALAIASLGFGMLAGGFPATVAPNACAQMAPTFPVPPLAPPMIVTGMFGERRPRHFHAGLDLSTGGVIGAPVRAPMDGWVERVRTQGVGYGRAIYLHTVDGRLVVLGHLDAFAEPLASFVAGAQDSSGQYEQDFWPAKSAFPVRAGQVLAWSGKSGTGQPHLHIEVRRGDMAYDPLRAGIPIDDPNLPDVVSATIEPLDGASWVERGAGPLTRPLGVPRPETLLVEGRVRVIARAVDPGLRGGVLAPMRLRATWEGRWIEWRADSASWATDMVDVDYVYDVGRAIVPGAPAYQLWAPAGWRPKVLATNVADTLPAGLIEVRPGDPPRPLRLEVTDEGGHRRERVLWLRGPSESERGPSALGTGRYDRVAVRGRRGAASNSGAGGGAFEFDALPFEQLRVSYRGAPADLVEAKILGRTATRNRAEWHAIVPFAELRDSVKPMIEGRRRPGIAWADSARPLAVTRSREHRKSSGISAMHWSLGTHSDFEPAVILYDVVGRPASGTAELVPISDAYAMEPTSLPLRAAITVRIETARELDERAGLYSDDGGGWDRVGGVDAKDPKSAAGQTRTLGRFAVMADTLAPRVQTMRPGRRAATSPYSQWALRARVAEAGSGVDPKRTFFVVDGKRVPTEFDAVRRQMVWRPLARPARGRHDYTLEARDRAGNVRKASGTFVLD